MSFFFADVKDVQNRVREAMERGAVTPYYGLDLPQAYEVLNAALASEIVCVLRYKQHYFGTTGIHREALRNIFKEHWQDEEAHLMRIAERLKQLGGLPNFAPAGLGERSVSPFATGQTLAELLREDLLAERVVVKIYGDVINFFGTGDPVTRRIFEEILADEEDHADDLADLLYTLDPGSGRVAEAFTGDSAFTKMLS